MSTAVDLLARLRQRPHTSVSQIRCFLQCPRRHSYQFLDRIRPDFRTIALAFGTAWHAAIGEYLACGITTAEAMDRFRDVLTREVRDGQTPVLFEGDEDLGECIDLGTRMVDTFIGKVPRPDSVLGVEVAFSLDLPDPKTGLFDSVPLIGAIDALVIDQGRPTVWELKTAKKRWTQDQLEFDLQPTAYRMGARLHEIDNAALAVIVTTKARLPAVQFEHVTRTGQDERELALMCHSIHMAIDHGVDHPVRGWQCRTCPYQGRCG